MKDSMILPNSINLAFMIKIIAAMPPGRAMPEPGPRPEPMGNQMARPEPMSMNARPMGNGQQRMTMGAVQGRMAQTPMMPMTANSMNMRMANMGQMQMANMVNMAMRQMQMNMRNAGNQMNKNAGTGEGAAAGGEGAGAAGGEGGAAGGPPPPDDMEGMAAAAAGLPLDDAPPAGSGSQAQPSIPKMPTPMVVIPAPMMTPMTMMTMPGAMVGAGNAGAMGMSMMQANGMIQINGKMPGKGMMPANGMIPANGMMPANGMNAGNGMNAANGMNAGNGAGAMMAGAGAMMMPITMQIAAPSGTMKSSLTGMVSGMPMIIMPMAALMGTGMMPMGMGGKPAPMHKRRKNITFCNHIKVKLKCLIKHIYKDI